MPSTGTVWSMLDAHNDYLHIHVIKEENHMVRLLFDPLHRPLSKANINILCCGQVNYGTMNTSINSLPFLHFFYMFTFC